MSKFPAFTLAFALTALAQSQTPTENRYEVVSIKPGDPGVSGCGYHASPAQLRLDNCPLPFLILSAYQLRQDRLFGLPAWATSATYSLVAKSAAPASSGDQWSMLAAVFEERFGLKYHRETRQMRVYELAAMPGGIRFPESMPGGCAPLNPDAPQPTSSDEAVKRAQNACGMDVTLLQPDGSHRMTIKAFTMARLASQLQDYVGRPVLDRTGSSKLFDIDLSFDNRSLQQERPAGEQAPAAGGAAKKVPVPIAEASGLPTIFNALKKAGLALTAGQGGVEVMVVDKIERPSEN